MIQIHEYEYYNKRIGLKWFCASRCVRQYIPYYSVFFIPIFDISQIEDLK